SMGTLFDEMQQVVQDQLCVEDLGYTDNDGQVSGEDVIRDIIEQGEKLSRERRQQEQKTEEKEQAEVEPNEQVIRATYYW
ncbi:MAG TPA: hypothetical protein EYQ48_04905, partial [Candidatus Lambdaproteobacteria bacterium]|nr:hypothetical protein [Candidatus Lambdaproteobacteria bacterium]